MTKFIDVCSKPESDIQRYSPTLIDTIAFVTGVLFAELRKIGRGGRADFERRGGRDFRAGCGDCDADCCARGNGGGS